MSDRSEEAERGRDRDRDRRTTGPFGTMFGATFGPFGAAVGSVVDANRMAFTFSFGTGVPGATRRGDEDLEDAATIEIEDTGEEEVATGDEEESDA